MSLPESVFIGCRIRIISKANIRYVGDLLSIVSDENNDPVLTLAKVMSFGTEDRPCERPVGPRSEVYDQIAFRGRDLVDLQIIKPSFINDDPSIVSAELEVKPKPLGQSDAPGRAWESRSVFSDAPKQAHISSQTTDKPSTIPTAPNFMSPKPPAGLLADIPMIPCFSVDTMDKQGGTCSASEISASESGLKDAFKSGSQPHSTKGQRNDWHGSRGGGNRGFRPAYNNNQRYGQRPRNDGENYCPRGGDGGQPLGGGFNERRHNYGGHQGDPKTLFKNDYDIEKANAELAEELEKLDVESTSATTSEQGDTASKTDEKDTYDSNKSFFDTLSSEIMDRAQGLMNRRSHREDRRQNYDTFGPSANRMGFGMYRGGGGYRGRRGGPGGYGGGYRNGGGGGYRNGGGGGYRNGGGGGYRNDGGGVSSGGAYRGRSQAPNNNAQSTI